MTGVVMDVAFRIAGVRSSTTVTATTTDARTPGTGKLVTTTTTMQTPGTGKLVNTTTTSAKKKTTTTMTTTTAPGGGHTPSGGNGGEGRVARVLATLFGLLSLLLLFCLCCLMLAYKRLKLKVTRKKTGMYANPDGGGNSNDGGGGGGAINVSDQIDLIQSSGPESTSTSTSADGAW